VRADVVGLVHEDDVLAGQIGIEGLGDNLGHRLAPRSGQSVKGGDQPVGNLGAVHDDISLRSGVNAPVNGVLRGTGSELAWSSGRRSVVRERLVEVRYCLFSTVSQKALVAIGLGGGDPQGIDEKTRTGLLGIGGEAGKP
jgi:hypothetical protein